MSAPVKEGLAWHLCGCGCRPKGCAQGCACRQCQPGEGIDYEAKLSRVRRARNDRMKQLLALQLPTPEEQEELDGLLHWYLYSN